MNNCYLWKHVVTSIVHDDWGGFYDHLATTVDAFNNTNGFRVPALCVGAYCTNAVNYTAFTFESTLKYLEVQYGIPALNARDAAAKDLCTSIGGMVDSSVSNPPLAAAARRTRAEGDQP
jgi:hypothetical protein